MQTENKNSKSIFLLFSHKLTDEQIDDLKKNGIDRFVYLPENLQILWSNIPPDKDSIIDIAEPFFDWLNSNVKKGDWVLVQGDAGICFLIVQFCFENSLTPVYATTQRTVIEKKENGKIIKTSYFKHSRFRKYERYKP